MRPVIGVAMMATCLALPACNRNPAENATGPTNNGAPANEAAQQQPAPLSGPQFASFVAANDAFEIAASDMAVGKAPSPWVKDFARGVGDAHKGSMARLKSVTATAAPPIKADATLSADQQQKLDALKSLSGDAFEKRYVADQIATHEAALATVQAYADHGDIPFLQGFAKNEAAMLAENLKLARRVESTPKGGR
jgi:putative membrane protein